MLEAVLSTQHTSAGLASVWPSAVLLGVITAVLGLAGVMHAPQMVFGLQGLGRSLAGTIGAAVALLAVAPLLVPVALLALLPGLAGQRAPWAGVLPLRGHHDAEGPGAGLPG